MSKTSNSATPSVDKMKEIPMVDWLELKTNRAKFMEDLRFALAECGFLILVNAPGLDDELTTDEQEALTGPSDELAMLTGGAESLGLIESLEPREEGRLEEQVPDMPDEAPGARTLSALLLQVAEERAEQLLLEPLEMYYRVRIRRGGRLRDAVRVTRLVGEAAIERAMVRAGMDPAQPGTQTGRINIQASGELMEFEAGVTDSVLGRTLGLRAREAGFRSLAPFNRSFKDHYNVTPSDYRQKLKTPN